MKRNKDWNMFMRIWRQTPIKGKIILLVLIPVVCYWTVRDLARDTALLRPPLKRQAAHAKNP